MQCPTCDFEAPQADFGDPLRCPKCGAFYEKALRLKLAASAPAPAPAATPVARPVSQGAATARQFNGAQPVVVVDVQMPFWSMVVFIVKWTLAAIPAMLILMFFLAAVASVAGVWFSTLFK